MRIVGVVTVARSDYGIYRPLLKKIKEDEDLELRLIVAGMHLSSEFGMTVHEIEEDGFEIKEKVEMNLVSDTPEGIGKSMGMGVAGYSKVFSRLGLDILYVLGDRFEMHAAALAALPFNIPVAHIHGGEVTEGAIDDALRHSITKLSHLHFVSTEEYARRVVQLGEEPWRVKVTGALGLDNLKGFSPMDREELGSKFGIKLGEGRFILITFHPVTLEYERTEEYIGELLSALDGCGLQMIFTLPNADTNGRVIIEKIEEFVTNRSSATIVGNFGLDGYFSMMAHGAAMVGNSSSGIIEAASFELPVVNIGNRQKGRIRGENVIDVECNSKSIAGGIKKVLEAGFRKRLSGMKNPYGFGDASTAILDALKNVEINERLLIKRFHDVGQTVMSEGL